MNDRPTFTGTIEDVAAFFRVSIRTVQNWKETRPPVIGYWQQGRNVCFSEEAVVELWVSRYAAARRMAPGEAADLARAQWRAQVRANQTINETRLADLERRLSALESPRQLEAA